MEGELFSLTHGSEGKMMSTGNGLKVRPVVTHASVWLPHSYLRKYQTESLLTKNEMFFAILAKIRTFRVKVGVDNLMIRNQKWFGCF